MTLGEFREQTKDMPDDAVVQISEDYMYKENCCIWQTKSVSCFLPLKTVTIEIRDRYA